MVSGVEIWKVTPSKSLTVWSMEAGGALTYDPLALVSRHFDMRNLTQRTSQSEPTGSVRFGNLAEASC